jgi:T4-like virus Myoviridae tail sheath stabiliser
MQQFFYDEQIRRFLLQFTRIFSNFSVEYGRDESANATLIRVPVRYGDATRQAQTILQENSANSLPSTPLMTFYITGMDYDRPRMQDPYHVNKMQVRQRYYDTTTDSYETTQGNAFTIERLMPVPYKMTISLDIWTSNTNQKMQLFEQIATLFNPALELQGTDNFIDWTSLSVVELESVTWTSRTIPQNTENPIDIMTMRFGIPIWISSPAKVKKLGVVDKIIYSVFNSLGDASDAITNNDLLLGTRQQITPYGYQTLLIGNKIQILKERTTVDQSNSNTNLPDSPPSNELWPAVVGMYGVLRPGISQIRLEDQWDGTGNVTQNTLAPIDSVIDPLISGPGVGLPSAVDGTRYLLLNAVGAIGNIQPAEAWGPLVANANDIVQYIDGIWDVVFRAVDSTENLQFCTNLTTGLQYRWTGSEWVKSYEGIYSGGTWSLVL